MQLLIVSTVTKMAIKTPDAELAGEDLDYAVTILGTVRNVIECAGLCDSCERIDRTVNGSAARSTVFLESDRSQYLGGYPFGLAWQLRSLVQ